MIKQITMYSLGLLWVIFSTSALADKFPFQNTVYAKNCNVKGDSLVFTTYGKTGKESQISLNGNEISTLMYDHVEVKDGTGGLKLVIMSVKELSYQKTVGVTQNLYVPFEISENGKTYIANGRVLSTGLPAQNYQRCDQDSIAKLDMDSKLSQFMGASVCIGCPEAAIKYTGASNSPATIAQSQRDENIDAILKVIQPTLERYNASDAKADFVAACKYADQILTILTINRIRDPDVQSYFKYKKDVSCELAKIANPPSMSCSELSRARQKCKMAGNYGQCISVEMDSILKGGYPIGTPYQIGQAADQYFREKCMK